MELIAEIGQNHNGDMGVAKELIWAAKERGADVAKFQVYDARSLFPSTGNPWFEYNCKTELSRDQIRQLAEECAAAGIEFMASVFDVERIAWLEEVAVRRYKIASRSIADTDLISAIAATGKPLIVSLGMWDEEAFPVIPTEGEVSYLYCVSKYPTPLTDLHLASIDFSCYHGFSDHTVGIAASMVAMSRGAGIIEKHFTLDHRMYGPDHAGSMDVDELAELTRFREELIQCL